MRTFERLSSSTVDAARILPLRVGEAPQTTATIMLVEADPLLADSIKYTLEREGYRVVTLASHDAAVEAISVERPALVMVELASATSEALELCRMMRASTTASIIAITPPVPDSRRLDPLRAGADDLLFKPFSMRELVHRVTYRLRRDGTSAPATVPDVEIICVGPVEMDVANHEVRVRGKLMVFPPKEFSLLETLLRSRGRLLTRARLIATVWGTDYYGDGKTLDTHVKRLREKIELDPRKPDHLIVVRGLGYRFLDPGR